MSNRPKRIDSSDEPYSLGEKIILGIGILIVIMMCSCTFQMLLVRLGEG